MKSLSVGHFTDIQQGTGLTVFLFDQPAMAAYIIPGSSPATREVSILDLDSHNKYIDGLLLTGGSAFGLSATEGVMRWLTEHNRGKKMPHGLVVPIVPTAAIYDLAAKSTSVPTPQMAYDACKSAKVNNLSQGQVGAGTGAMIGKLVPNATPMNGGLGVAYTKLDNGLEVIAYAVVNAVGDVFDRSGSIIGGAKNTNGSLINSKEYFLAGYAEPMMLDDNTTLVAVFTNANFSRSGLKRIAKMTVMGMAQSISPVFTPYDGDIIFCVSLGDMKVSEVTVGTISAEMVRQAIVNAIKQSN